MSNSNNNPRTGDSSPHIFQMRNLRKWWTPVDVEAEQRFYDHSLKMQQDLAPVIKTQAEEKFNELKAALVAHKLYIEGYTKANAGDFENALILLNQASEADPRNMGLRCDIIKVLMELEKFNDARIVSDDLIVRIENAMKINQETGKTTIPSIGNSSAQEVVLGMYQFLCKIYIELHEYPKCIALCKKMLALGSQETETWWNLGVSYYSLGNSSESIDAFQTASRKSPSSPEIWVYLGLVKKQIGDNKGALKAFQQATQVGPGYFAGWVNLAETYIEFGKIKKAREAYLQVLKIDPSNSLALARLSHLHK